MCANDSEDSWRRLTEENRDEADPAGVKVLAPHIVLSVDFRFVTQGPRGDRTSITLCQHCKVLAWKKANMTKLSTPSRFSSVNISSLELSFQLSGYRDNECIGIVERMDFAIT